MRLFLALFLALPLDAFARDPASTDPEALASALEAEGISKPHPKHDVHMVEQAVREKLTT